MAAIVPVLTSIGGLLGASGAAATAIGAATVGFGASKLVGGGKSAPAAAAAAPVAGPKVMPLADGEAVAAAKKRSITMQMQRGGRSSTMLTGDSETLG